MSAHYSNKLISRKILREQDKDPGSKKVLNMINCSCKYTLVYQSKRQFSL